MMAPAQSNPTPPKRSWWQYVIVMTVAFLLAYFVAYFITGNLFG